MQRPARGAAGETRLASEAPWLSTAERPPSVHSRTSAGPAAPVAGLVGAAWMHAPTPAVPAASSTAPGRRSHRSAVLVVAWPDVQPDLARRQRPGGARVLVVPARRPTGPDRSVPCARARRTRVFGGNPVTISRKRVSPSLDQACTCVFTPGVRRVVGDRRRRARGRPSCVPRRRPPASRAVLRRPPGHRSSSCACRSPLGRTGVSRHLLCPIHRFRFATGPDRTMM